MQQLNKFNIWNRVNIYIEICPDTNRRRTRWYRESLWAEIRYDLLDMQSILCPLKWVIRFSIYFPSIGPLTRSINLSMQKITLKIMAIIIMALNK